MDTLYTPSESSNLAFSLYGDKYHVQEISKGDQQRVLIHLI